MTDTRKIDDRSVSGARAEQGEAASGHRITRRRDAVGIPKAQAKINTRSNRSLPNMTDIDRIRKLAGVPPAPTSANEEIARAGSDFSFMRTLREFKMDTPDAAKGMFDGDSIADLEKRRAKDKKKIAKANDEGKGHAEATKDLRRTNFAIRARKSKGDKGWHKEV